MPREVLVARWTALLWLVVASGALPGALRPGALRGPRAIPAPPTSPPPRAAATGALAGFVHTLDGTAVSGAQVVLLLLHGGRTLSLGAFDTDAAGRFVRSGLPTGSYRLVVTAPGLARALVAARVSSAAGDPVDVTLAPGATLTGQVVRVALEGEEGFAGAVVRAYREGEEGPAQVARADAEGRFVLSNLAPGAHRLEVVENGAETLRRVGVPVPTEGLALRVRALASLEGVVRDAHGEPARGATVLLAGSGVWPARTLTVMDDGRFVAPNLPGGVYELRAAREDDVAEPLAPLLLDPGQHREVTLALGPGATLSGVVLDGQRRRPVAGAEVVVGEETLSTAPRAVRTGADGSFRVAGLLRRGHTLAVRATGYAPVTGLAATPGTRAEVVLDEGVALAGRVIDGSGRPVAGARIEVATQDLDGRAAVWNGSSAAFRAALFEAQARGPRPLVPAGELGVTLGRVPLVPVVPVPIGVEAERSAVGFTTAADGTFALRDLPPGVVTVRAEHPAYVRVESEARVVRAGETAQVEVVLHTGGVIEGRALTERGFPVSGLQVEARCEGVALPVRVFTQRDGSFRVPTVRGRVALVAFLGARVAARAEVEVADDQVAAVTLTLPGALRRVAGRVVDGRGFPVAGATLSLTTLDRAALGTATTISAADGTFDTLVGGHGPLELSARHPEFAPRNLRLDDPARPVRVELSAGASVRFALDGGGCLEGDARVELRTVCGPVRQSLADRAEAEFARLCAGRAELVVDAPGCVRAVRAVSVPARGVLDLGRVELNAGGGAEGEVLNVHGEPVVGAVVAPTGSPPEVLSASARSDRRGAFRAASLPLGNVALVAWHAALGQSEPVRVRVIRGTVARGVRLRFGRDQGEARRAEATPTLALRDLPARGGGREVEVTGVSVDSPAERAGVRPGDVLTRVGGIAVVDARDAEARLRGPTGDDVVLELCRDGQCRTVRFARGR